MTCNLSQLDHLSHLYLSVFFCLRFFVQVWHSLFSFWHEEKTFPEYVRQKKSVIMQSVITRTPKTRSNIFKQNVLIWHLRKKKKQAVCRDPDVGWSLSVLKDGEQMLSVWVPAVIKGDKHVYTHADVINSLSWPVFFPRTYPLPQTGLSAKHVDRLLHSILMLPGDRDLPKF